MCGANRGSLLPDPRYDAVAAVILAVMDDNEDVSDLSYTTRVLICDEEERAPYLGIPGLQARLHGPWRLPGVCSRFTLQSGLTAMGSELGESCSSCHRRRLQG